MGAHDGTWRCGEDEWVKGQGKHAFLAFIHTVNRLCEERGIENVFGEPTHMGVWWTQIHYAEEYPRARVIYPLKEHRGRGEGYRIVTDDHDLWGMWADAAAIVEPTLEVRSSWDPDKP